MSRALAFPVPVPIVFFSQSGASLYHSFSLDQSGRSVEKPTANGEREFILSKESSYKFYYCFETLGCRICYSDIFYFIYVFVGGRNQCVVRSMCMDVCFIILIILQTNTYSKTPDTNYASFRFLFHA